MASSVSFSVEDRKRLIRRLIAGGRGFAEQYGIRVTNNPGSLFQVLVLSLLLRRPGDFRRAVSTTLALCAEGWDSPARMARSLHDDRVRVLRACGWRSDVEVLASTLGDLALTLTQRYRGDLRRLRAPARYVPQHERQLLMELPGVDEQVAELFLRETQALWPEVAPVADQRALTAARKLGLGRSATDLAELAGGRKSEKLAWLVGALARVEMEDRYAEIKG